MDNVTRWRDVAIKAIPVAAVASLILHVVFPAYIAAFFFIAKLDKYNRVKAIKRAEAKLLNDIQVTNKQIELAMSIARDTENYEEVATLMDRKRILQVQLAEITHLRIDNYGTDLDLGVNKYSAATYKPYNPASDTGIKDDSDYSFKYGSYYY